MSAVAWMFLTPAEVRAGDLVSAEAGGMPIYRVMGIEQGYARLSDVEHAETRVMPLDRLHWRAAVTA